MIVGSSPGVETTGLGLSIHVGSAQSKPTIFPGDWVLFKPGNHGPVYSLQAGSAQLKPWSHPFWPGAVEATKPLELGSIEAVGTGCHSNHDVDWVPLKPWNHHGSIYSLYIHVGLVPLKPRNLGSVYSRWVSAIEAMIPRDWVPNNIQAHVDWVPSKPWSHGDWVYSRWFSAVEAMKPQLNGPIHVGSVPSIFMISTHLR